MNTRLVYEVVDLRDVPVALPQLATLATVPGGIQAWGLDGRPVVLLYDDEHPDSFSDDGDAGVVEVRNEQGRVIFSAASLATWRALPSEFRDSMPTPDSDADVQRLLSAKIAEAFL